jgi:23S rRNA (uracil1939-C5)-methyltransferase
VDINCDSIVNITGIAGGGEGVCRIGGKTVFVRMAAPGDHIRCRVTEEHKTWARAELAELIEPSPDRIEPRCPYYGVCGGCDLQHISYNAQIVAKTAILRDCFTRIGGFQPPEPAIYPCSPWEYRNRMQLHCVNKPQTAAFGLKGRKSSEIIPITDCPIADPGIRAFLNESKQGYMPSGIQERFTVYAHNGLFLRESGSERSSINLLDRKLQVDVSIFFQSNAAMLEKLIGGLIELVRPADHSRPMADLYGGGGTFAAFLGEGFPRIDLMEHNTKALSLARENTADQSVECFDMRDTEWAALNRGGYGFVIADPPRQGMAPALANWVAAANIPLFVYVSCNPATLARDSALLCRGGYRLAGLALYDFYPQTSHIESVAVFINNKDR